MNRRDAIRRVAAVGATLALPAWAQSSRIVLGQSAAFTGPAAAALTPSTRTSRRPITTSGLAGSSGRGLACATAAHATLDRPGDYGYGWWRRTVRVGDRDVLWTARKNAYWAARGLPDRLGAAANSIIAGVIPLPNLSVLVVSGRGTGGVVAELLGAAGKPQSLPGSYGGGAVLLVGGAPGFLFDILGISTGSPSLVTSGEERTVI